MIEQRDPSPRPGSLLNWRESAGPGGQGVTAADRLSLALNHNQDGVTGALAHGDLILGGLIDHLVGGGGVEPQALVALQPLAVGIGESSGIKAHLSQVVLRVEHPFIFGHRIAPGAVVHIRLARAAGLIHLDGIGVDIEAAKGVVDHLGGGGIIVVGVGEVGAAAGGLGPLTGHSLSGLPHEVELYLLRRVGLIDLAGAPGEQDALNAGVQRGQGVHGMLIHKVLEGLDLGLGGGAETLGAAIAAPGVGADHLGILIAVIPGIGLNVVIAPLIVESAVHVDAAGAGVVAQLAVLIPVGTLHAEAGHAGGGGIVGLAAVEGRDIAVAVNIRVRITERNPVAVGIGGPQVGTVIDYKGLLVAVGVNHGVHIDDVVIQDVLHIFVVGVGHKPPCGVQSRRAALALAAVDVAEDTDPDLSAVGNPLIRNFQAPQGTLLPASADLIQFGDVGILLGHVGKCFLDLAVGEAAVPVNVCKRFRHARGIVVTGRDCLAGAPRGASALYIDIGASGNDTHKHDSRQAKGQDFAKNLFPHKYLLSQASKCYHINHKR